MGKDSYQEPWKHGKWDDHDHDADGWQNYDKKTWSQAPSWGQFNNSYNNSKSNNSYNKWDDGKGYGSGKQQVDQSPVGAGQPSSGSGGSGGPQLNSFRQQPSSKGQSKGKWQSTATNLATTVCCMMCGWIWRLNSNCQFCIKGGLRHDAQRFSDTEPITCFALSDEGVACREKLGSNIKCQLCRLEVKYQTTVHLHHEADPTPTGIITPSQKRSAWKWTSCSTTGESFTRKKTKR
jgi:hypothetical protein